MRRLPRRSQGGPELCTRGWRATTRACQFSKMGRFTYMYVLQSETEPNRFYTGCTDDLRARLGRHNRGEVPHTSKCRPWRIKTYVGFSDRQRARNFESYLKSASGPAFLKKRLWSTQFDLSRALRATVSWRHTPSPGTGWHPRPGRTRDGSQYVWLCATSSSHLAF
jgi:putative endonuclease